MSTAPEQDLSIFKDGSIVSDALLNSEHPTLSVISHAQATQPAWLLNTIIENTLVGTAVLVNRELTHKVPNRALLTYISFTNNREFVEKLCRKHGLSLDKISDFSFINCFSDLFTRLVPNPAQSKSLVSKLFDNVSKTIQRLNKPNHVVIIEDPQLLLAATDLSSNDLIHHLRQLNALCRTLFVVADADPATIDFESIIPNDPRFKITDFLVKLHHTSCLNLNILPLSTGRAEDLTGCFTISRGSLPAPTPVVEKEYIYFVNKESNVKFYVR